MNGSQSTYEYKIQPGDTLSRIVFKMSGVHPGSRQYRDKLEEIMKANPQITDANLIRAGDVIFIVHADGGTGVRPPVFVEPLEREPLARGVCGDEEENLWLLSWLAGNHNYMTIPVGVGLSTSTFVTETNRVLMSEVLDEYGKYKQGISTKGQYDYQRRIKLDRLKKNIGPFERMLFGSKTPHEALRIARGGGVNAGSHITKYSGHFKKLAKYGKAGGFALTVVGVAASCKQIGDARSRSEKNEIFVDTLGSIGGGVLGGVAAGLFLVSNPVGWGAALIIAAGSAATGYVSGKVAKNAYDLYGNEIDLVGGTGVDKLCR